ncbi:MAG: glycerophosphodiester phosphodiesterase family protein [Myxococcota bacterium]|jgi:glycerophosphoryl diester phosphodiesterase|nr:glycerophosphodiester phosphodiesterase family protein [Myxococcota bacterium]
MTSRIEPGRGSPLLVAHRGVSARFPENTLAAFHAAVADGARMLELDVGLSADGVPVVLHDETLDRTTDGRGPLSAMALAQVAELDAGSWFGPAFAGEPVPTLARVLDEFGGRIAINVEIKPEAVRSDPAEGIEEQVVALVRARALEDQVVVSSFEPTAVGRVKRLFPGLPAALLYHHELPHDAVALLALCEADGLHVNKRHVTAELVETLHAAGRYVGAYTANSAPDLRRLTGLGVDAIFTDDVVAATLLLSAGSGEEQVGDVVQ